MSVNNNNNNNNRWHNIQLCFVNKFITLVFEKIFTIKYKVWVVVDTAAWVLCYA